MRRHNDPAQQPLRQARAQIVLNLIEEGRFRHLFRSDRSARSELETRGLTLSQRDQAINDLVIEGKVEIETSSGGFIVRLVKEGERDK